ncbi:MAG TPA: hypothetical protein ENH94_02650 [Phycisphaerales bacterium]|nr:hypothetical protein [Phycisphaerales bacterium]
MQSKQRLLRMPNNNDNSCVKFMGNINTSRLCFILAMMLTCCLAGCGDFFAKKPTEIESRAILEELRQVKENPNVNNPLPEVYTKPPSRLKIKGGVKLFYFTRHHSVGIIAELVTQQLGHKVVQNSRNNQLVIYCGDDAQADKVLEYLELTDVPPIQVNIDCLILERFGDVTMDWETSIMIENFLGEGVTLGENRGTFGTIPAPETGANLGELLSLDPAFPGAALRESERADFGLDFGYWIDRNVPGHQVRALVDVLESRGYLKILLNPTLETINGKTATVTIKDYAPIEEIQTGKGGQSDVFSITKYQWVEDTLTVTPSVYANGYIGLDTKIKVGSRSKPEGVAQRSIITERSITVPENRIRPGHSLIIGGMRKSEKRSVIRGIPFFKDIPIFGVFFSSKDFEEKGTEIIFILTPTISSGGRDNSEVVADIRRKHESHSYKTEFGDWIADPLGTKIYTEVIEERATVAESAKVVAEMKRASAEQTAEEEKAKVEMFKRQVGEITELSEQLKGETQKAIAESNKTKADAASAKAATDKAEKDLKAARQQLDAGKAQTDKLRQELKKAKVAEAARLKAIVEEKERIRKAAEEAGRVKAEAEAERLRQEAEKAEPAP